jgi:hypothetical protein
MLWKLNFITIWVFEFDYRVLSERENKIHFVEANTPLSIMTPCRRDADLKNSSRRYGERDTPTKQHQGKVWATKAPQDLPINVAINNRLLACKVYWDKLYIYVKHALRADPYFQVLISSLPAIRF